jgi:hypothetical protein
MIAEYNIFLAALFILVVIVATIFVVQIRSSHEKISEVLRARLDNIKPWQILLPVTSPLIFAIVEAVRQHRRTGEVDWIPLTIVPFITIIVLLIVVLIGKVWTKTDR